VVAGSAPEAQPAPWQEGRPRVAALSLRRLVILLATGVLTLGDIAKEGDVLATFIWFAVLFTLSGQLDALGFMGYLGGRLAGICGGFTPLLAGVILIVAYVLLHYLFVSQTAHLLALFGVFLDVGKQLGVPLAPLAFQLLFATNFFSANTPQGSSANLLFAGSGYLSQGDLYRLGALTTAFNLGKSDEAQAAFLKAVELDPANAEPHFYLGSLAVSANDVPKAVAHFEKYVSLAPANAPNLAAAKSLLETLKKK